MEAYVCRVCLQSGDRVRLTRRDLSTFYAVCAMFVEGYQMEACVWVCTFCWSRTSQCLKFINLARHAEFLLRTNSGFDIKPEEFHPYTFTRLQNTTICGATECQILTGMYSNEHIDIIPLTLPDCTEKLNKDSWHNEIPLPEVVDDSLNSFPNKKEIEDDCYKSNLNVKEELIDIQEEFNEITVTKQAKKISIDRPHNTSIERMQSMPIMGYELIKLTTEQQKEEVHKKKQSNKYRDSLFKCQCGACYLDENRYNEHMKMNLDESLGPYECKICCHRFINESNLLEHTNNEHEYRWRCVGCKSFVRKVYWSEHKKNCLANAKQHECEICPKKYLTKRRLKKHIYTSHTKALCFTCDYCKKMFKFKHQMANHIRFHTGEKPFECKPCGLKFPIMAYYKIHMLKKHTEQKTEPMEDRYCVKCDKYYKDKKSLEVHHTRCHSAGGKGKPVFACETCPKTFTEKITLQTHVKRVHLKLQDFICTECDKRFADQRSLKLHTRRTHRKGDRPRDYVCDICGAAFTMRSTLKIHTEAVHEKKRPYKCNVCTATFGFAAALYTHNKLKHKGEKRTKKTSGKKSTSAN